MPTKNAPHDDPHPRNEGALPPVEFTFTTHHGWETSDWKVRSFELVEELSKPYHLQLEVISADPDIDVSSLVGGRCELALDRGQGARLIPGIIHAATGVARGHHRLGVKLTIVPALALLAHRRSRRIFNDRSVPEVVELVIRDVLARFGRDYEFRLDPPSYGKRPSITQHDESDLEFIERILADEGIHYHFVADGTRERVVFADPAHAAPTLSFGDDDEALPVVQDGTGSTPREGISEFAVERTMASESAASRYWNHQEADQPPREESRGDVDDPAALSVHDSVAPNPVDPDVATRRARLALEAAQVHAARGEGQSDAIALTPGHGFSVTGHGERSGDRGYLLTKVIHRGDAPDAQAHGHADARPRYTNLFVCIPDTTPYRPPRPTGARAPIGPQTAIVVGPEGEEIHCDAMGRVLVCFAWDRRAPEEAMTCWARVAQEWAGPGFGAQFIPRVGTEVMICFLDGDPDQPVITKCLHNSQNPYPFPLPDNKAVSGLRSDSTPGGGGCNELMFDDTKGREELRMRGHRDVTVVAGNDYTRRVGGNQTITVQQDLTQTIHGDHKRDVEGRELTTVDSDYYLRAGYGIRVVAVTENIDIDAESGQLRLHSAVAMSALTDGSLHLRAKGSLTAIAEKSDAVVTSLHGGAAMVGHTDVVVRCDTGPLTLGGQTDVSVTSSTGGVAVAAPKDVIVDSKQHLVLRGADGVVLTAPGGPIAITAAQEITIDAASSLTLRVGMSFITLSPTEIKVSSPRITSTATGIHTVGGAVIRLN